MNGERLEEEYQERLDENLMAYLAEVKHIPLEKAMDIYYHSRMAKLTGDGAYGIQYLDHKVLVQMMLDTEPELFEGL